MLRRIRIIKQLKMGNKNPISSNKDKKRKIKFVCISDTHTKTKDLKLPPGDVLIHAGDFSFGALEEKQKKSKASTIF